MNPQYDFELEKVIERINRTRANKVLIQLPDGLKIDATEIVDEIEKATKAEVFVWAGSCFGACDVPDVKNIDLLIQFGHTKM
jgi:diphthamide biosynthesis enzyme Dph1/Dph2-like protein